MKIYNGYERLPRNYTLLTDEYEYTMSAAYLLTNKEKDIAVFDAFFRKVPNEGGYAIMAGVDKLVAYIKNLHFGEKELDHFRKANYPEKFIEYLKNFKFTGDIYAIPDGTPVFPNEPLITVKAPLIEAQIVETAILCMINGAMEHATGARRIIEAIPKDKEVNIMEFGARRADGLEAAIDSSIYGIMAGCAGTSNAYAAEMLNVKALGTMAHSFIESYDTELDAFKAFATIYPNNCILLVDTIDTLRSGVPNAIKTFDYMKEHNIDLSHIGIRIDSGDLAYLSKEARKMLDNAGYTNAKICLSNGLTDKTIESLVMQGAKFDSLGVGDNISKPAGRMGCVYKEIEINTTPKIKLSNDSIKIVNPGFKTLYRAYSKETGYALADIITRRNEEIKKDDLIIVSPTNELKRSMISGFRLEKLQKPVFINGECVYEDLDIKEIQKYCNEQMDTLYEEVKRTEKPHEYYIDGTEDYVNFKNQMIRDAKNLVKR